MNGRFKLLLLVALIIYIISPVDLVPGPIDDIILAVAYLIPKTKAIRKKED